MQDIKIRKLVQSALFAALCLVLTKVITIPAPTGYINLGDCAVLLSAWLLGPWYGGAAAGVGTMLADILSGYASYAPATFVIKFAMAAAAALLAKRGNSHGGSVSYLVSAVAAEGLMAAGYFLYECLVLGVGTAALASLPANILQGAVGAAAGMLAITALAKHNIKLR